ncbi:668b0b6b-077d-4152-82df-9261a97013a6 [Thermothielavioides terrestris]|uniref:668b0b6b-077d-4152-82df-9261a97013a6 n=1 Tax=Thermothielavioides terrestris TaxID=2587410 RepID=A0A3S4D7L5_9PEZI|nr:668b0b6b-077d-4152-82df-9261a97013a6 [Thermothielavioides terrestris]
MFVFSTSERSIQYF